MRGDPGLDHAPGAGRIFHVAGLRPAGTGGDHRAGRESGKRGRRGAVHGGGDARAGSAALTVHTDDDSVAEDDSTVTAALQPGTGYQIGDRGSAGVRIVDNDRAPIVPMGFAYVPFDEPDDRVDTK